MKTKQLPIYLLLPLFISCKENVDKNTIRNDTVVVSKEFYYSSKINQIILKKSIDKFTFKKKLSPYIDSLTLYSEKHKILKVINDKLNKNLDNSNIFAISIFNLKKEILKLNLD